MLKWVANSDCIEDYVNDIQNCIGLHTCDEKLSLKIKKKNENGLEM